MKQIVTALIFVMLVSFACSETPTAVPVIVTQPSAAVTDTLPAPAVKSDVTGAPRATNTVVPSATVRSTATKPVGTSRDNPIPAGQSVVASNMSISITGATRPADLIVAQGNMFNTKPEAGKEYVMIEIAATCAGKTDQKCLISPYLFKVVGPAGIVYDAGSVAGVAGMLESGEFFGGAKKTGKTFFIVGKDEKDLVMIFGQLFGDVYFAVPK